MTMTLEEYLAVPYVLTMESVCRPDGEWVRRASYPEPESSCASPVFPFASLISRQDIFLPDSVRSGPGYIFVIMI